MRLGIDFGTTRTVVAAAVDGRHPLAAFDDDGVFREYIPGLAAQRGEELLVGWGAAHALTDGTADRVIRSIKRTLSRMGPDDPVPGLTGITALELATAFLSQLRRDLVERSNLDIEADEPLEVMAAVPANSPSRQRWLTLEALRCAGFVPIGLLNEPTAAAIDFASRHLDLAARKSPKRYLVVYDLGGGTFDASAVSLEGRRFELIACEGLANVGGDDFDSLILEVAGIAPTAATLEAAREAKESLRPTTRSLLLEVPGATATINVATLYQRAQPIVDATMARIDLLFERLRERGIAVDDPRELGGLYLVGGGASFPPVARTLRARFARKLQLAPQPFAATAVGLAIAADTRAQVMVHEAVTRHFGVWREGDAGADKIFDPLLGKNTAAPVVVSRRYRPIHAVGHLRFLECGALDARGQPVQDLVPFADVYFPYDPALANQRELSDQPTARRPDLLANEIAETYTYNRDGTISIRIENVSAGYARSYSLSGVQ